MIGTGFARRAVALLLAAAAGAVVCGSVLGHARSAPPVLSDSDIGFAQDMTAHHQQAVTMTDMLAGDAAPDVKALAEQIRFTQLTEIGQMTGWLQLAAAPPVSTHPMAWMTGARDMNMAMPGMATVPELKRLQSSTGVANRNLFLQLMTRHHEGGIEMAAYAFGHSTNDAVRRAAGVMVDEQTQEVQLMATMLDQAGDRPS